MNYNTMIQKFRTPVLTVTALALMAGPSLAVDLVAIEGQWSPDDGDTQIPMWGFATDTGQACGSLPAWTVGPQLDDSDLAAGSLTIKLRNCLSEAVSIIIPGQPARFAPVRTADGRVMAFTTETPADGVSTTSYTWSGVKDGTYLYQSGSHPAKQVQMGLYGALTIKGISYPDAHDEVTLLYSEIDPALHSPPAAATPLGYHPRHYLVNGSTSQSFPTAGDTNHPTLLRFLNAGLDFHVPTLNGGGYMSLVAEDGNLYPFAKQQYSANLAAGKTIDALWLPDSAGDYVIYDRRGNGMVATLTLATGVGAPVAADDSYDTDEGVDLPVIAPGVLDNDDPGLTAILVSAPSNGILDPSLATDGSFTYKPNANFNGSDVFTYRANDGSLDSNVASVTITVNPVNDKPVADPNGPYTATVGVPVTLDGTGSSDIDVGDTLTYQWDFDYDGTFNVDDTGSMPVTTYASTGLYTVALVVNDATEDSAVATTTVDVGVAVNTAPVAVGDFDTVVRNTTKFINLSLNDSDVDINLCINPTVNPPADNSILCSDSIAILSAAQFNITTGLLTTRGGAVTVVDNGVNYTPKKNFRGTDTFNYIVSDLDGAPSNEVTVRVNVVKP